MNTPLPLWTQAPGKRTHQYSSVSGWWISNQTKTGQKKKSKNRKSRFPPAFWTLLRNICWPFVDLKVGNEACTWRWWGIRRALTCSSHWTWQTRAYEPSRLGLPRWDGVSHCRTTSQWTSFAGPLRLSLGYGCSLWQKRMWMIDLVSIDGWLARRWLVWWLFVREGLASWAPTTLDTDHITRIFQSNHPTHSEILFFLFLLPKDSFTL